MTVTLDAATEARIQQQIDSGNYRDPAEFVAHAVSLIATENDFIFRNKEALLERLDESMEQAERGETIPGDQVREMVARQIAEHRSLRAG
jgi:Arc/MetJ-type ribon-helix-helix transcriptional regulator